MKSVYPYIYNFEKSEGKAAKGGIFARIYIHRNRG